ncbi:hypothetical protein ACTMU2_11020 [Cupriavidus basilensis]
MPLDQLGRHKRLLLLQGTERAKPFFAETGETGSPVPVARSAR